MGYKSFSILYNDKVNKSAIFVENIYSNKSGATGAVTTNAVSGTTTKGVLSIGYGYNATTVYYTTLACGFSSNWGAQISIHTFNTGTAPVLQLVAENISINWNASTRKLSITRGDKMYYANLNASGSNAGSNTTTMKIFQVTVLNVSN